MEEVIEEGDIEQVGGGIGKVGNGEEDWDIVDLGGIIEEIIHEVRLSRGEVLGATLLGEKEE